MKKKVLFVATVDSHIELFHLPFLKMFKERGWEVHVATNSDKPIKYCDKKVKLPMKRSPFKFWSNLKAVRELKRIMQNEKYEIVHCHTPVGSVVARLAARKMRQTGMRVIYTAHGFHFYKGAPLHYWLMFYPVEWYLAKYTDTLITINNEDYERARRKFGKRCRDIQYVPGVGVDEKKFAKRLSVVEKKKLRESLGLEEDDKVLICIGRLDKNKNQGFLIRAMKELINKDGKYQLLLVGPDEYNGKYQKLASKLGVERNVHFLGFRRDIAELLQISDVVVSASKREGLPVNLIEAAMLGVPIVATDCRGNRDVCKKNNIDVVGFENTDRLINAIKNAIKSKKDNGDILAYEKNSVNKSMKRIYGLLRPLVSVIVPAYNVEKYIVNCIDSILNQTYAEIEVIVVDDGSTDNTLGLLRDYADRIKIITQENRGLSVARNVGTDNAKGEYILYVDSDDFLANNWAIEDMVRDISIVDSDILFFRFNYYFDKASIRSSKPIVVKTNSGIMSKYAKMIRRDTLNISAWSKLIKLDIIKNNNIRFKEGLLSEDIDFSLQLYGKVSSINVSDSVYYNYRQKREGSITNNVDNKNIESLIYIIKKWTSIDYLNLDYKWICMNYMAYQYSILLALCNDDNTTKEQRQWIKDNDFLLNYSLNFKVKMTRLVYVVLGPKRCAGLLKKYNKFKNNGLIKI